ncbi:hypothetical protein PF003_g17076 [Phytophthora fragariae]|nr:hypothetical protein PF003_g17076 [Phytophthora fragariae]
MSGRRPGQGQRDYWSGFDTTGAAQIAASMKPSTAHVLPDMYAVLSFVKSDKKSHVGAKTRSRPARLLERLRHDRSSADRRLYEAQNRAHVAGHVVRGAELRGATRLSQSDYWSGFATTGAAPIAASMKPSTALVLPDMSYAVLSFVKSDKKSHVGAKTRSRPARLLERLRHHRSSADRRQYEAQHRARVTGHVRGAELRDATRLSQSDYWSGFATTRAAQIAASMKPSTALVLPDMSYAVLSFVKSDKKSHVGAKTRSRPARLLERLRHHRSSADRRQYEAQHRARVTGHVRGAELRDATRLSQSDYWSGFATTGAAPIAASMKPSTAHVLPDMSYAVLSFVKSDKKSHVGAKTRSRPARLLERLRHHRSSADRRLYEAQNRAHVAGHVVRGAELRGATRLSQSDYWSGFATTGAAPIAASMKPSTALVLPDMSYAVLSFVKSDKKSHVGAKTRSRPARLLERLRHHRSSADRRLYEAQNRAHVAGHVVRGAELRGATRLSQSDYWSGFATTGAAPIAASMKPSTALVLPDMSYAVLSFVKSDKKSHVGAKTRSRPARLLERLRHHRSSADRRQYEAQHRARVTGHVRGAELREERQEVACRGEDQVKASATTGAASTPPE